MSLGFVSTLRPVGFLETNLTSQCRAHESEGTDHTVRLKGPRIAGRSRHLRASRTRVQARELATFFLIALYNPQRLCQMVGHTLRETPSVSVAHLAQVS